MAATSSGHSRRRSGAAPSPSASWSGRASSASRSCWRSSSSASRTTSGGSRAGASASGSVAGAVATTTAPATRRSLGARSIAEAFRLTAEDYGDRVAVRTKDDAVSLTWAELRGRVDALAGGLAKLGVRRGDTVALMLGNRPEIAIADLAAVTLGATPFSIYATSSPDQIAYTVGDAGARVAIVEEL